MWISISEFTYKINSADFISSVPFVDTNFHIFLQVNIFILIKEW